VLVQMGESLARPTAGGGTSLLDTIAVVVDCGRNVTVAMPAKLQGARPDWAGRWNGRAQAFA